MPNAISGNCHTHVAIVRSRAELSQRGENDSTEQRIEPSPCRVVDQPLECTERDGALRSGIVEADPAAQRETAQQERPWNHNRDARAAAEEEKNFQKGEISGNSLSLSGKSICGFIPQDIAVVPKLLNEARNSFRHPKGLS